MPLSITRHSTQKQLSQTPSSNTPSLSQDCDSDPTSSSDLQRISIQTQNIPSAKSSQATSAQFSASNVADQHLEQNYQKALERLNRLFSPERQANKANRAASEKVIDTYLRHASNQLLPSEWRDLKNYLHIRELMILVDMATQDVHQFGFPYGRWNVLVRNKDSFSRPESRESERIHLSDMRNKVRLTSLAQTAYTSLSKEDKKRYGFLSLSDASFIRLASQLTTGVGSCSDYASLLTCLVKHRYAQSHLAQTSKASIEVNIVNKPQFENKQLDHALCKITYTLPNHSPFTFYCDPWADLNMPLFSHHSRYKITGATKQFTLDPGNLSYPIKIKNYMQRVQSFFKDMNQSRLFPNADNHTDRFLKTKSAEITTAEGILIPIEKSSLQSPWESQFYSRETLDAAQESVQGLSRRRASLSTLTESDLLR